DQPPQDSSQLTATLGNLYPETLQTWVANHHRRREEITDLRNLCSGHPPIDKKTFEFRGNHLQREAAEQLIPEVQRELDEDRLYLENFDRNVFVLHGQLAEHLGKQAEFARRYRFHLEVQRFLQQTWDEQAKVKGLFHFLRSQPQYHVDQMVQVEEALA